MPSDELPPSFSVPRLERNATARVLTADDLRLSTARKIIDQSFRIEALPGLHFGSSTLVLDCGDSAIDALVTRLCRSALQKTPSIERVAVVDLDASAERLAIQFGALAPATLDRLIVGVRRSTADSGRAEIESTASDAYLAATAILRSVHAPSLIVVWLRTTQASSVKAIALASGIFARLARSRFVAIVLALSSPLPLSELRKRLPAGTRGAALIFGSSAENFVAFRDGVAFMWAPDRTDKGARSLKAHAVDAAPSSAASPRRVPVRETIISVLAAAGANARLSPAEIAQRGAVAPSAVRVALASLVRQGPVIAVSRGLYRFVAGSGEVA